MALRTCMICPAGHGAQRRERNQQHVAPVAHAAHMQRGSCTTVEHRAHVWHAAARALVAHHAVCRAAPHQHARGDHRARHARAARQLAAHSHPACARRVHQLPARARTERQRAARARVGTQQMLPALPLQQQLVLVRAARLILHAHRDRCAQWMLHTHGMHAQRVHLPRRDGSAHSQWDWGPHGARLLGSSSRHPNSTPHVTPRAPDVPHGHVGCRDRGEGERRP